MIQPAIRMGKPMRQRDAVTAKSWLNKLHITPADDSHTAKKCVLVVDDDRRVLNFVGISLRVAGYEVLTSLDGEQALIMAKMAIPDIVVLDILMPGMNGFEVLSKLREFSRVPVLVFSVDDSLMTEAIKRGATDFIVKPLEPDELVVRIEDILTGQHGK